MKKKINIAVVGLGNIGSYFCNEIVKKKKDILLTNINEHNFFVKNNIKKLRYSLTHGDANNYNLVVKKNEVVGLLDYGDMIYAPTINDLAVALSYALMNKNDLYSSLENIVKTYHNKFKINFEEFDTLKSMEP